MTTPLSLLSRKARLLGLRNHIDSNNFGTVQFYSGNVLPASPETTAPEAPLCVVELASPNCGVVSDSNGLATLTMAGPRIGTVTTTGVVGWMRIVNGAGEPVLDTPVVKAPLTGPVVVSDTQVYAGGELQLISCVISE